jgi:hypothetical protein
MPSKINSSNHLILNVFSKESDIPETRFMTIFGCFHPLIFDLMDEIIKEDQDNAVSAGSSPNPMFRCPCICVMFRQRFGHNLGSGKEILSGFRI